MSYLHLNDEHAKPHMARKVGAKVKMIVHGKVVSVESRHDRSEVFPAHIGEKPKKAKSKTSHRMEIEVHKVTSGDDEGSNQSNQ